MKVKSSVTDAAARAKEEAARMAAERKETAASRIGSYSEKIHQSARNFEQEDPNIAWFTHRAADRLQGVADYVRNRDLTGLRQDVEQMARRHPAAFFGGLFVAGIVLGNVVKASRRNLDETSRDAGQDGQDDRASEPIIGQQDRVPPQGVTEPAFPSSGI
jgi:hypothetical protein